MVFSSHPYVTLLLSALNLPYRHRNFPLFNRNVTVIQGNHKYVIVALNTASKWQYLNYSKSPELQSQVSLDNLVYSNPNGNQSSSFNKNSVAFHLSLYMELHKFMSSSDMGDLSLFLSIDNILLPLLNMVMEDVRRRWFKSVL